VGKTTTASAMALHAARRGRRAVAVTIDPAKRLADALGVAGGLTNEPTRIPTGESRGELWAMMLDTETTFDGLIREHATSDEQVRRILSNRFYRNIAGALSGTQEYMAAEKLYELHNDRRFDLVVVDTPPTRNALDFLRAPHTLARFLAHPVFRMLMAPARRSARMVTIGAQPAIRAIGGIVGNEALADTVAFFQAFTGMEDGFHDRALAVHDVLRASTTAFVLVASPRADTAEEALAFAATLASSGLTPSALVLNRLQPAFGADADPLAGASSARRAADEADRRNEPLEAVAWRNLAELRELAGAEAAGLARLTQAVAPAAVVRVPMLTGDVHDLAGVEEVRRWLFEEPSPDEAVPGSAE